MDGHSGVLTLRFIYSLPMRHFLANGLVLVFIGQATTMRLALEAGLREDQIVCDSHAFPLGQSEVAMVAADGVLFFHRSETVASQRL